MWYYQEIVSVTQHILIIQRFDTIREIEKWIKHIFIELVLHYRTYVVLIVPMLQAFSTPGRVFWLSIDKCLFYFTREQCNSCAYEEQTRSTYLTEQQLPE